MPPNAAEMPPRCHLPPVPCPPPPPPLTARRPTVVRTRPTATHWRAGLSGQRLELSCGRRSGSMKRGRATPDAPPHRLARRWTRRARPPKRRRARTRRAMTRTARRGVLAVWYLRVACSGVHAHAFAHDACACPCAAAASASLAPIPVCCLCDWQGAAGQSPGSASSSAAPLDSLDGRSGEGVGQMEQAGSRQDRAEIAARPRRDRSETAPSRSEIVPRSCRDCAGLPG